MSTPDFNKLRKPLKASGRKRTSDESMWLRAMKLVDAGYTITSVASAIGVRQPYLSKVYFGWKLRRGRGDE